MIDHIVLNAISDVFQPLKDSKWFVLPVKCLFIPFLWLCFLGFKSRRYLAEILPQKVKRYKYVLCNCLDKSSQVSENSACVSRSTSSVRFPNREIQDVMKKNYNNNPNLLWQYYAGTDGTFLIYPAHSFNPNCFSYDPRLRYTSSSYLDFREY